MGDDAGAICFIGIGRINDGIVLGTYFSKNAADDEGTGKKTTANEEIQIFARLLKVARIRFPARQRQRLLWGEGAVSCLVDKYRTCLYLLITNSHNFPERIAFRLLEELGQRTEAFVMSLNDIDYPINGTDGLGDGGALNDDFPKNTKPKRNSENDSPLGSERSGSSYSSSSLSRGGPVRLDSIDSHCAVGVVKFGLLVNKLRKHELTKRMRHIFVDVENKYGVPAEVDKVASALHQVDVIRGVVQESFHQAIAFSENVSVLEEKSTRLSQHSFDFGDKSAEFRSNYEWNLRFFWRMFRNQSWPFQTLSVLGVLVFLLWLLGPLCSPPSPSPPISSHHSRGNVATNNNHLPPLFPPSKFAAFYRIGFGSPTNQALRRKQINCLRRISRSGKKETQQGGFLSADRALADCEDIM